ncbi:tRNA-modifying protein YgfZ [Vibrio hippocampi]|uniref:tRNA-modifying protein YgfZ n=1 Tax=Vibrio hippocampi TaxID=654686 RepID=A0ABM8ZJS1_9VIBR|nr:tRNA-modifying protein YgfZ [Vibrio hippocampi]CAH0527157.1 tRNA-modifying protein YgfZ [Vibrio hippocampi]
MDWFPAHKTLEISASTPAPNLMFTRLASWGVIEMTGDDKKSYLQGQVTCDVVSLNEDASVLGAHCDAKGKVWSLFRLFNTPRGYGMAQPLSAIEKELTELKKYAIFSKVEIITSELPLFGVIGEEAEQWINDHFPSQGDVRQSEQSTAIKIDGQRWMVLCDQAFASQHLMNNEDAWVTEALWRKMDIEAGLPILEAEQQNAHIPQAFNLDQLGGISFHKGCYTGQETVARAKYRGINKRMMATLSGELESDLDLSAIEIERSVGDNWRKAGDVLASYYADKEFVALVILPNNLDDDTQFRVTGQSQQLQLSLPSYLAEQDD